MSFKNITLSLLLCLPFLFSCAPMTEHQVKENGWTHLASEELLTLFPGNTIQLRSAGFSGLVWLNNDGKIASKDYTNNSDTGLWNINKGDQLCLKFDHWYFNDIRCYSVYTKKESGHYTLFSPNGAVYSTAKILPGDPEKLALLTQAKDQKGSLKSPFALGKQRTTQPKRQHALPSFKNNPGNDSPTEDEMAHTVRAMAQDCPGCNLEGADLSKASLIGANLAGARLKRADMSRANLRRAHLNDTDLSGALLIHANLPGADLRNSDLHGANLTGANLIRADLTGADIAGAIFTNAHLESVKGLEKQP